MVFTNLINKAKETYNYAKETNENRLPKRFFIKGSGTPYHVSFLQGLDESLSFPLHYVKGEFKAPICDKFYGDDFCQRCEEGNIPSWTQAILSYIYDLDGTLITTKRGTTFEDTPEKIIEIGLGTRGNSRDKIEAIESEFTSLFFNKQTRELEEPSQVRKDNPDLYKKALNTFQDLIFILKKEDKKVGNTTKSVLKVPQLAKKELLTGSFEPEIPQEVKDKYNNLTIGEKVGMVLAAYGNVKWDLFTEQAKAEGVTLIKPVAASIEPKAKTSFTLDGDDD